jgi:hypothetical protein
MKPVVPHDWTEFWSRQGLSRREDAAKHLSMSPNRAHATTRRQDELWASRRCDGVTFSRSYTGSSGRAAGHSFRSKIGGAPLP